MYSIKAKLIKKKSYFIKKIKMQYITIYNITLLIIQKKRL